MLSSFSDAAAAAILNGYTFCTESRECRQPWEAGRENEKKKKKKKKPIQFVTIDYPKIFTYYILKHILYIPDQIRLKKTFPSITISFFREKFNPVVAILVVWPCFLETYEI